MAEPARIASAKAHSSPCDEGSNARTVTWLALAACAGLYFGPPLFALMWAAPSWGTAVAVAVFAGCLLLFWVFAVYGLTNACWALLTKVQGKECRVQGQEQADGATNFLQEDWEVRDGGGALTVSPVRSRIALLYPTRNDLREEAVAALRRVRPPAGGECVVVICDDSTLAAWREKVDECGVRNAECGVEAVVRRSPAGGEAAAAGLGAEGGDGVSGHGAPLGKTPNEAGETPSLPTAIRVIRRSAGSAGWKAGNVNHALRVLEAEAGEAATAGETGKGFDYFAVCDADGVFPADFVERTLPYFTTTEKAEGTEAGVTDFLQENREGREESNAAREPQSLLSNLPISPERVALVQTRQKGDLAARTRFSRSLAPAVGAHFRQQVAGRAASGGFVMFYGHGALISMQAWREQGGLPEIVTEDLAFSMRLREAGWRGVYADEVVCGEEFPLTWPQLRKRTDKWIRGTGECLRLHGPAFFRAPGVPWREKLDVLMHVSQHFLAVPMLVFLGLLATVLPWGMKEFRLPGSFFLPPVPEGKTLVEAAMGLRYHVFWSWDFYLMMVVAMLAPVLPLLVESAQRWRRARGSDHGSGGRNGNRGGVGLAGYFAASTFTYLAGMVAEGLAVAAFAVTGQATFRTTNDAAEIGGGGRRGTTTEGTERGAAGFHPNHPAVFALEVAVGVGFLSAMWAHRNLWFLGPGMALLLSPVVAWRRGRAYEQGWVRVLAALPALSMAGLLVLIGWQLARWR